MRPDAAIVGGGLAGAALAIRLAQAGRAVTLWERSAGPHDKVCGEFISTEALVDLRGLGVDPAALGAVPIGRVRITAGRQAAEAALPFPAASLSRRVLDEALLARAAAVGVTVRRGAMVRAVTADSVDGSAAGQVVLATGKHEVRGHARVTAQPRWVGLKLHLRLAAALPPTTGVHLFPGGYAGLQPIEAGWANLCLATGDAGLAAAGRDAAGMLAALTAACPALRPVLEGAEPRWDRPVSVAGVPYGFLHAGPEDGVFRLGDQFAAIPSFCGDGMAIALHSARLAAEAMLAGGNAAAFHRGLRAQLRPQFRRAAWLSRGTATAVGRHGFIAAARLAPGLLALAAAATRVPCPA